MRMLVSKRRLDLRGLLIAILSRPELPSIFISSELKGVDNRHEKKPWPGVPIFLLVSVILATVGSVFAHHGWSGYDSSKALNSKEPSWSRATNIRMVLSGSRRRTKLGSSCWLPFTDGTKGVATKPCVRHGGYRDRLSQPH